METETEKERELVPVPLRRCEPPAEKELSDQPPELPGEEIREMPRRWYVY